MQTYDLIMVIVLLGATAFGFMKGMAWQVAYLASLVVSFFVAKQFSPQLAPMFGTSEPFNRFAAWLAIYVATSFGIWMVFRGVAGAIDRVKLNEFDRQMGALIGFARGVLWCILITFFAATLLESQRSNILNSKAGHYIGVLLAKSDGVFPPEVEQVIGPWVDRIEQGLDPNQPAGTGLPNLQGLLPSGQGGQGGTAWPTGSTTQPTTQPGYGAPAASTQSQGPTAWPASTQQPVAPAGWPSTSAGPTPWPNQ